MNNSADGDIKLAIKGGNIREKEEPSAGYASSFENSFKLHMLQPGLKSSSQGTSDSLGLFERVPVTDA